MQSCNDLEFWMDPAGDPTGMNILNKNENALVRTKSRTCVQCRWRFALNFTI
jgi:hypothetical protein